MDGATRPLRHHGRLDPAVVGAVGGQLRDEPRPVAARAGASEGFWAYIDVYDLADAIRLAAEATTPGHEVVYIASPDIASHESLEELARRFHGDAAPGDPAVGRGAPERDLDRQGAAAARLRPAALVARLPRRRRPAARPRSRERLERGDDRRPARAPADRALEPRRVALDEAARRCAARAASAGRPRRARGVEAQAGDHHVGVAAVGVDRDPARPCRARRRT